jgi:hypothetical protein
MANKPGISKTGFIADLDRYGQVWNHPAIKFESKILRSSESERVSAYGTVKRVKVRSKVTFSAEINPFEQVVIATSRAKYDTRTYTYWLDLDSSGKILGGEWISQDRPDFLWFKEKDEFTGYWEGIKEIYQSKI